MVGRKLHGKIFRNRDELWDELEAAFKEITPDQVKKLYASLPNRMKAVQLSKGWHTRY
jgi:hypothetical protein